MTVLLNLARWLVWPIYLLLFLGAYAASQHHGYDPGLSILAITVAHMALIAVTEIALPARQDWVWWTDGQVFNDIVHGVLLDAGGRLGSAALTVGIAAIGSAIAAGHCLALWPGDWPLWAQVALGILLYDFCDYWKHRAYHQWAWLWPVHALHHNPGRMHVFKAGRLHFLEAAIRAAISSAPLVLLGAPPEVFFWLAALANAFGGQNHWNVDARLPRWLDLLIATPGAHWLHHRKEMGDGSANLSTYTLLFDHLFGTYRRPAGRADYDVGIADDPISSNIFAQLAAPAAFLPSIRRWRRARDIRSG